MDLPEHYWINVDTDGRALQVFNIEENARLDAASDTRVMGVVEVVPAPTEGAVSTDDLRAALEDVLNHWVLSDKPEEVVIDRASELLDRMADHPRGAVSPEGETLSDLVTIHPPEALR